MQKNRIGNQKTIRNRLGTIAVAMGITILLLGMTVPAVSASSNWYGYGAQLTIDGKIENVAIFYIPHSVPLYNTLKQGSFNGYAIYSNTCGSNCVRPYIGGVYIDPVLYVLLGDHRDPQKWDFLYRRQVGANVDETVLLVPTRYALANPSYGWQMYLQTG